MIADPIAGVKAFLLADPDVAGLVETRVFGEELPLDETASMPRKCIVIESAGAPGFTGHGGYQDYGDIRIDLKCFAETPYEARKVQRAVYGALKNLRRGPYAGVMLYWAKRGGGPIGLRDPDTSWPYQFESHQVLVGEVEVT